MVYFCRANGFTGEDSPYLQPYVSAFVKKSAYFVKTPQLLKLIYPHHVWSLPAERRQLFLTFDDGPTVGVTDEVLDILERHSARATFFLVGKNAIRFPELVERIRSAGHQLGNHTFHHLNGWQTRPLTYVRDILLCDSVIRSAFFRPPYGRMTRQQAQLAQLRFTIVMWDVLSGDFDPRLNGAQCLQNVRRHAQSGSIVVFHDSVKAASRMLYVLPRVLDHFGGQGYEFLPLPDPPTLRRRTARVFPQ